MRKMFMVVAAVAVIAAGCATQREPTPRTYDPNEGRSWVEYEACMNAATYPRAREKCLKVKP